MPVIALRTLGTLDLHSAEGRELHSLLAQPKRVALLAYLCVAQPRGFHRRDTLLGLFWPDSNQEHARTSLRKSLHILRRAVGDDAILSRGDEEVAVDSRLVSCDALTFEASVKANRLEEALELYGGDLLAGFFIDEAPEFDRWLHSERTRLRASAARAAGTLSDQLEGAGNLAAAVTRARYALELADTDERALQKLIELQCRSGDRAGAIQTYETFARRLATEYQTEPSAETRSLIERIRSGEKTFGRETEVKVPAQTGLVERVVGASPTPSVSPRAEDEKAHGPRGGRLRFALAALAIAVSVTAIWGWTHPPSKQVLRYTLTIDSAEAMARFSPFSGRVAISPDGSRFAYVGGPENQVLMRLRNELHATAMAGTEGAFTPFFSPDGKSVGFLKEKSVWIAPLSGGPPIHVSDSLTGVAGASWGSDGFIYTNGSESAPLARVEARQGAVPRWFTALDTAKGEFGHSWPDVLPNGHGVVFMVLFGGKNTPNGKASSAIAVADIPSGKHRVIIDDAAYPAYVSSGILLYVTSNRTLMMVPFDQNSMRVTGEPTALIEGLQLGSFGATDLAVSSTGTLVYSIGPVRTEQDKGQLVWMTRDGKPRPLDPDWQGLFQHPALSPDGKQLAITQIPDGRNSDIWIRQLIGGATVQLTHDRFWNAGAEWTPDGRSVTFHANAGNGAADLLTQRSDGSTKAVLVFHGGRTFRPRWSPDGKWLTFEREANDNERNDIVGIRPGIDTAPVPLVATGMHAGMQAVSPDSHWMAYGSDVTGRFEIYVVPFPNTKAGKWQISTLGGVLPKWSAHGNEIIYRNTSGDVMSVAVMTAPTFSFSKPRRLFVAKWSEFPFNGYAVSPDGQRILMIRRIGAGVPDKLIVVENWFEELRAKARN
ncbi:MAG TPA: BTAD domain-containing putative transcriptional regulator [Gemmatimonadaceae bacterium]